MNNEFYSKETYLQYKLPRKIPKEIIFEYQNCKDINEFKTNKYSLNELWWESILIPTNDIPECTNCKNDFIIYQKTKKEPIKPNCGKHCLWYEWFLYKRELIN